jgi:hypothetical protein
MLFMRYGQLMVNGALVPSPSSFVLPDSVTDAPQAIFTWQHRIEIRGTPMLVCYSSDPEQGVDYVRAITAIRRRRLGTWIH